METVTVVTGGQQGSSRTRLGDRYRGLAWKKELILALEESLRLQHEGAALVHQLQADRFGELLGRLRRWSCRLLARSLGE